ncbi:hypothetical protein D869_gp215 [Caulobacter phage CcrRogue]|uniref:Uncharacterized protein n=1 Tax=Caulobacter phage CcrRogue TaxID=2927986 RepID=K4JNA4_9CAUD|nr:hypothetical protein D869_gp215 [Caulobacter phage CcrRogue]AFU86699.1 hypothetical protein CcrRogue_gp217 [Caulobacter phage CcrRogue]
MEVVNMTIKGPVGDLRDEAMARVASRLSGFVTAGAQVPSPNLAAFKALLEPGGKLAKFRAIGNIAEVGGTLTEDQEIDLYDGVGMLVDCIEDLIGMCERREQALAECDVQIGGLGELRECN